MASLGFDRPDLPAPAKDDNDPFVSVTTPARGPGRYVGLEQQSSALSPGASPDQVKRALESHLAETDRRLDEAGKLGTALVAQRKALAEQLQEVDQLQTEGEMNDDLRQKLVGIEKEYNDLARESARVFLPKQRIPSNETNPGSPFPGEGRGGRRSVSPSKFESQATASPTKLNVPNRKSRNQPSNRVHDIEFAAEISTSLIAQVRNLQTLLAERDDQLKTLESDRQHLELENENLHQRVKVLDENEHRYKEENWNLETKLQEVASQQREAADREKKLQQSLNVTKAEKASAQKELDEVKLSHAKLADEHAAAVKHHDIELGTAKRNIVMAEGERAAMQRKIEDLTGQNTELAKAFSMQRGRLTERELGSGPSDEDLETANDNVTPDQSPPPSPIKGTPRHSMLETETLKTSLHHAQRTLQSQRSILHREKTEKLELRRIIQDLRDDLEKARSNDGPGSATTHRRSSRKVDSREFKKPPRLFGSSRTVRQEIFLDDPDWEDTGESAAHVLGQISPGREQQPRGMASATDSSDHFDTANEGAESAFDTANEGGESAFETANERATETDFVTGNEDVSGSEDTETEITSRGFGRMRRPPSLPYSNPRNQHSRASFDSTASTSADEDYASDMRTPVGTITSANKPRQRLSRLFRGSRQGSEEPGLQSSPATASFAGSNAGTPQAGQSLFAELADMGSDGESSLGAMTPSRRSARSVTPGSTRRRMSPPPELPALPKVIMVDSGVMTDPIIIADAIDDASVAEDSFELERPRTMESVIGPAGNRASTSWLSVRESEAGASRPVSTFSYSDASAQHEDDITVRLSEFPLPPNSGPEPEMPSLAVSEIQSESVEPREEPYVAPLLSFTTYISEATEPIAEPATPPPALNLSNIVAEDLEPVAEPEVPPPALTMTPVLVEALEPIATPEAPPAELSLSGIAAEFVEPKAEVPALPPVLSISHIKGEVVEPIAEPGVPLPTLVMSTINGEHIEPIAEPAIEVVLPALTMTSLMLEHVEPIAEPEPEVEVAAIVPPPTFSMSDIIHENIEPVAAAETPLPVLTVSSIQSEVVEPVAVPEPEVVPIPLPELPILGLSSILSEIVDPVSEPDVPLPEPVAPPSLTTSMIMGEHIQPIAEQEPEIALAVPPPPPALSMTSLLSEHIEPVSEPEVIVEPPTLSVSSIYGEQVEPREEPVEIIVPPSLSVSSIYGEHIEPREEHVEEPIPVALGYSSYLTESVAPVSEPDVPLPTLAFSGILTEDIGPIAEPVVPLPSLGMSAITTQAVEPMTVEPESPVLPNFAFTGIESVETVPVTPRSPWREAFILPRDKELGASHGLLANGTRQGKSDNHLQIFTDEDSAQAETNGTRETVQESQLPFRELSNNAQDRPQRAEKALTTDQGAQTSLTSSEIEKMSKTNARPGFAHTKTASINTLASNGSTDTVKIHRQHDLATSTSPKKLKGGEYFPADAAAVRRPGSAASTRTSTQDAPPLPNNHRQIIEQARTGSSQGNMGPPLWPASATRNRPQTPQQANARPISPMSPRGTTTPRTIRGTATMRGNTDAQSVTKHSMRSRQSSVSSFASELDNRFNMRPSDIGMGPHGFGSNTDPRMIQAITQTMIGEFLWKYTRRTGRGGLSENRHRRYFWVHPYTRTLYWSDEDPSAVGRSEHQKTKSVPIEAVRVVTDDNPMPPGLHRKSLIVIAPGRTIKFTATTGQRHETWFNALSYLLLRTNDGQTDTEEMVENITNEDVDEFNPPIGRGPAEGNRPPAPPSLSSYNSHSRASQNASPAGDMSYNIPTLTPAKRPTMVKPSTGTLSKLSGYWKSGGFGSLRGRSTSSQHMGIYEASEVHDSAEDLREMIEQQDRESDRLENVRACCDGKHDVGTLHHHHSSKRGRVQHTHSHPAPSPSPTPMATMRSRA